MFRGLRKKALTLLNGSQLSLSSDDNQAYSKILKQVHDFEVALKAMDFLLDDRTPEGIDLLQKKIKNHHESQSDQPAGIFHLALGVMEFLEATLGFEPEMMAKAHNTLLEAETASMNNSKYNTKYHLLTSHIYPPGTEFQVTLAELTLLNALIMLLQENNGVVESAKALYKLRKAYHTLDAVYKKIKELEPAYNRNLARLKKQHPLSKHREGSVSSVDLPGLEKSPLFSLDSSASASASAGTSIGSLPQDIKLMKELEDVFQMRKSRIEGTNIGNVVDINKIDLFADTSASLSCVNLSRRGSSIFMDKAGSRPMGSPSPTPIMENQRMKSGGDRKSSPVIFQTNAEDEESDSDNENFSDAYETLDESVHTNQPSTIGTASSFSAGSDSFIEKNPNGNDATYLHVSTIDEFIHSGVQLCFGILQVVLSLIPPTIGKVLSIVGFKGERDIGLKLLWRNAITCRNIHGDLALLCLLVFYDGPIQFVDSGFHLPEDSSSNVQSIIDITNRTTISEPELDKVLSNPDLYTPQLLNKVRTFFPHNALWLLQEGRYLASQGQIHEAINLMQLFTDDPNTKIQMQQSEALLTFDMAMFYAFNYDLDKAAAGFIKLLDLNSWSRSVYLYMAGSCYLTKWRMIRMGLCDKDKSEADREKSLEFYAKQAEKYLKLAPTYVPGHGHNANGKKGGIGGGNKQLPFDKFVLRKSKQLEERQVQYPNLPFVDIVATSPMHELIYFWNGYNRMTPSSYDLTFKLLGYSGAPNSDLSANDNEINYSKINETEDESMIRYFLQAVCLRLLGKVKEGLAILDSHVISKYVTHDNPFRYNRLNYSPYMCPTALYEKTMFVWLLKTNQPEFNVQKVVEESVEWLKKAQIISDVGDYELSNRTGMRIKAAWEKLDQIASLK